MQRGHDLPTQSRGDGSVPIMGSFGITGYHNEAKVKGPGVVVGRSGSSMGVVSYIKQNYWPLNTVLYVKDFHGNDKRFVYYLLKTINFESFNTGSAQASLNRNYIHPIKVCIPATIEEQRRIARILANLEDKIDLTHQINLTIEQIAQAIFRFWFVDFGPVTAKIQAKEKGCDPERAAMCAISGKSEEELDQLPPEQRQQIAETAALFPEELEESALGLIPTGWQPVKYQQLYFERKDKVNNNNASVLSAVQTGELKLPDEVFDKQVHSESIAKYKLVYPGDLAFNPSRINIGSAGFNNFEFLGAVSPVYTVMGLNYNEYSAFARMHLKLDSTKEWINILCSGSVRQSLSVKDFLSIPVVLPSKEVNSVFVKIFRDTNKKIVANNKEIKTLASISDTLLPKLLSGEIETTNEKAALS